MFQLGKEPAWLKWVPVNGHFQLLTQILRGDGITAMDWLAGATLPVAITVTALLLAARNLKTRP
jgi:hypothetical protein